MIEEGEYRVFWSETKTYFSDVKASSPVEAAEVLETSAPGMLEEFCCGRTYNGVQSVMDSKLTRHYPEAKKV